MRILCLGLSHKTADVAVRERLAFDEPRTARALADLGRRWPESQFMLLSTCNRMELYAARAVHEHPRGQELLDWLAEHRGVHHSVFAGALYELADEEAVSHLFEVAAGLDSLVPGEDQIVSQIKGAYAAARAAKTARAALNELVQTALHVAKHVRAETPVAKGKVSVASVAMDLVARAFDDLSDKTVLNIGAGKMNVLMLRQLAGLKPKALWVTNRSAAKARELAKQCGGKAVPFSRLAEHLAGADVVLSSTASPQPILTADMVRAAQRKRGHRPLLLVDVAVPRDVEESAGRVKNVRLHNIDDLDRVVQATLQSRSKGSTAARATIGEHVAQYMDNLKVKLVAPTIDALYAHMKKIADDELAAALRKLRTHDDADDDAAILQQVLHRTVRRIFHPAAANLRNSAGTDAARAHVAAVRKLFDLGE